MEIMSEEARGRADHGRPPFRPPADLSRARAARRALGRQRVAARLRLLRVIGMRGEPKQAESDHEAEDPALRNAWFEDAFARPCGVVANVDLPASGVAIHRLLREIR